MVSRTLRAFGRPFRIPALAVLLAAGAILVPVIALALAPDPPTNVVATPGADSPVIATLSWDAPVGGVDRYRVYVSESASGPFETAGETVALEYTFIDGLGGRPYFFKVASVNFANEVSALSTSTAPVTSMWSADPHRRFDANSTTCSRCHSVHSASNPLLQRSEAPADLPATIAICYACHDGRVEGAGDIASGAKGFSQPSGHVVEGTSTVSAMDWTNSCTSCHGNHRDSAEAPMIPQTLINGSPIDAPGRAWCYACHQTDEWFDGTYPVPGASERNAAGYPVTGTWPGRDSYESTANAHGAIPETTQTVDTGAVRRERGDCLYCHSAHGGPNAYDGLLGTYRPPSASTLATDQASGAFAAACFACHGGVTPSGFATAPVDVKQFVTAAGGSAGHRVKSSGGLLPVGSPLPCYECHGPHGSARGNKSLISDDLGEQLDTDSALAVREFCLACHTTADTGRGWDSELSTYAVPPASDLVVGLVRDATTTVLPLPQVPGHEQSNTASCESCHGGDYDAGGSNVHNPGSGQVPGHVSPTSSTCFGAGCHDDSRNLPEVHALYAGPQSEYPQYDSTCQMCHENEDPDRIDWGTATAQCTGVCHSGLTHAAYSTDHAVTAASDECVSCHGANIANTHGADTDLAKCGVCHENQWNWSKTADCVGCHNGVDVGTHAYSPLESGHFDESTHTATPFTAAYQGEGVDGAVAAGGKECSACHGSALTTAHSATSSSGGSVSCAECHTDAALESSATVAADWPNRRCTDCHDTGTSTTHDTIGTAHAVEAGSCAGTGVTCHNFSDLGALHAASQSGGAPTQASCANADAGDPSGCHAVLDSRPAAVDPASSCGEGSGGCHADMNQGNHGYSAVVHTASLGSGDIDMGRAADDTDHPADWSANVACSLCHYTDLDTQHGNSCTTCHGGANPVGSLGGSWGGSCQQGDCHPSIHTGMTPDHNGAYYNSSSSCDSCHTGVPEFPGEVDCTGCHSPADTVPDTLAPTTESNALPSYTGTATIVLTATDNAGGSGVDRTYFILDGAVAVQGTTVSIPPPATGSQPHTLQFFSVDYQGNTEVAKPVPAFAFSVEAGT